jgi:hypothetical protein
MGVLIPGVPATDIEPIALDDRLSSATPPVPEPLPERLESPQLPVVSGLASREAPGEGPGCERTRNEPRRIVTCGRGDGERQCAIAKGFSSAVGP